MGNPSIGSYLTEEQASYAAEHFDGAPGIAAMKAKRWLLLQCPAWRDILGETAELDAVEHSGKLQVLLELIQAAQEKKDKLLVFSQWTGVLDVIQAMLESRVRVNPEEDDDNDAARWKHEVHFYRIQGRTQSAQRQKLVEAFNRPDSEAQLCLLSTKAAGMGINLTAANRVVIFDSSWNPSLLNYSIGPLKLPCRALGSGSWAKRAAQRHRCTVSLTAGTRHAPPYPAAQAPGHTPARLTPQPPVTCTLHSLQTTY